MTVMIPMQRYFNPRSHKGSDLLPNPDLRHLERFQSTLPQGERRRKMTTFPGHMDFNPRSHKGSDISLYQRSCDKVDFNPRSHKGSDPQYVVGRVPDHDFNPRSHKGSDLFGCAGLCQLFVISIHAPTRGATNVAVPTGETVGISIHAPTRGATL